MHVPHGIGVSSISISNVDGSLSCPHTSIADTLTLYLPAVTTELKNGTDVMIDLLVFAFISVNL